ncbi:hypothetical protein [Streptomyces ipomoeae]|uniref:hypothetical protein n=1 Tax=Streptomyces ipomoeae TaxID=103232 RepID=UPI001147224F|nr:hypothetical protein [Streptomyces ipomoeae]TQE33061.1 hypothetical protein Sipo7851_21395 [Streptomyces ipomoeae]
MTTQTPTIGRIVHYVSRGSADGVFAPACRAALVTAVDDTGQPALTVFTPEGHFSHPPLPHADATEERGGTWHWPERAPQEATCG